MLRHILVLIGLACVHASGGPYPRLGGTPPSLMAKLPELVAMDAEEPMERIRFRIDTIVNSSSGCGDFLRESAPFQRKPPAAAYRAAMQDLVEGTTLSYFGVRRSVKEVKLACREPPRGAPLHLQGVKRISAVATTRYNLTAGIAIDMLVSLDQALVGQFTGVSYYARNVFVRGAGDKWGVQLFRYNNDNFATLCIENIDISGCSRKRWNPADVTLLEWD